MMGGTKGGKPDRQHPTPQGPGDRHGVPPDDAPGLWGTGERPLDPTGGKPAADPKEAVRKVLDQGNTGPEAAGGKAGHDKA